MNFEDLQKVTHLAHTQNIQQSASALHITAGALSKTLKKIEVKLNTTLFDRVGRNIQLNVQGKKFITYALNLTHEYEQMCSEFTNQQNKIYIKVSGPAVLLDVFLQKVIPLMSNKKIELSIEALYEGDAIKQLSDGQSHIAIVTNEALLDISSLELESMLIGNLKGTIVAGQQHVIFKHFPDGRVMMEDLLNYPFICPKTSPFCGIERGTGSDGWLDHKYPRKIAYRSDDFNSLLSVVNQGVALAYIADIAIDTNKQRMIEIIDFPVKYYEKYSVVYKPSVANGWLNQLMYKLSKAID